jgi:hypothetical protein
MGTGLFLLVGGFFYDTMFAGIPYQDPTPEMSSLYADHAKVAAVICWTGVAASLMGGIGHVCRWAFRRLWPSK